MEEHNAAVGQIDPANLPKIYLLVGIVAALIGIAYFVGKKGADQAEKKGQQRFFGFLLCFYFGPVGFWILNRLETNRAGIERQAREEAEAKEGKTPDAPLDKTPWTLSFAGRQPNWTAVYILMGVALVLTIFLRMRPEDNGMGSVDVTQIPKERAGWTYLGDAPATDESKKQMQEIKADSYVMRYYRSPEGQDVELYVVYRRYGRREFNHNPDQCFPAGGWQLMKRDVTTMHYAGAEHEMEHMLFDGKGVVRGDKDPATGNQRVGLPPATVCYFFASGDRSENVFLRQQLWMALERLVPNKNGWALVRLTTVRKTTDEDALATQKAFMKAYGDDIERVITTDTEHAKLITPTASPTP